MWEYCFEARRFGEFALISITARSTDRDRSRTGHQSSDDPIELGVTGGGRRREFEASNGVSFNLPYPQSFMLWSLIGLFHLSFLPVEDLCPLPTAISPR